MSFIDIHDLSVTYKGKNRTSPALAGISLSIERGETCIVTGPSGCGKSTLLKVLAHILQDYRGEVLIDGTAPDAHRHNTALLGYPRALSGGDRQPDTKPENVEALFRAVHA